MLVVRNRHITEGNSSIDESMISGEPKTQRAIAPMNLIQMDIMVRDDRAIDTGGWVFGNFAYNGKLGNENRWDNLIPVGIQWGNDHALRDSYVNDTPGYPNLSLSGFVDREGDAQLTEAMARLDRRGVMHSLAE